jgi:hypothetical protein
MLSLSDKPPLDWRPPQLTPVTNRMYSTSMKLHTGLHRHLFMTCQLSMLLCGIAASTPWVDSKGRIHLLTFVTPPVGSPLMI